MKLRRRSGKMKCQAMEPLRSGLHRIVVLSSSAHDRDVQRAYELGASAYQPVEKPTHDGGRRASGLSGHAGLWPANHAPVRLYRRDACPPCQPRRLTSVRRPCISTGCYVVKSTDFDTCRSTLRAVWNFWGVVNLPPPTAPSPAPANVAIAQSARGHPPGPQRAQSVSGHALDLIPNPIPDPPSSVTGRD